MWSGVESCQSIFNHWQYIPDPIPVLFPCKVDRSTILSITWAHPEVVGRNRAYFGNLKERSDLFPQLLDSTESRIYLVARHEIFTLQLFSATGGELHTEMRQTLKPRTTDTHLLCTVFGRECWNGVNMTCGERRAE